MILQHIAWPEQPEDRELFYRCEGEIIIDPDSNSFQLNADTIRFDTYFNAFSFSKWRRYTALQGLTLCLELKGTARVELLRLDLNGEEASAQVIHSEVLSCESFSNVTLVYPECPQADGLSFSLQPLGNEVIVRDAAYCAGPETPQPQTVNLALAICTYRREAYVTSNMDMLRRLVFDNPQSLLNGHVQVFIADNGQSLDPSRFDTRYVHIFPNVNSGGSGGFSRAAIEAVHDSAFSATHVILMDDDISFMACALERNYSFLRLLRPEYRECILGGTMLNGDYRNLLYAAGETYTLGGILNAKEEWDLRKLKYVLLSETDIPVNYFAWWYCCVPTSVLQARQYAMPFFVQFDDIEFSLRCNDLPKLVLNGVCCWHNPLERKDSDSRYYYNYRNMSIMDCIYYSEFTGPFLKHALSDDCTRMIFTYTYTRAHMMMRGVEDFLKGPDWLLAQDPPALNAELIAASEKSCPVEELPVPFDREQVLRNRRIDQNQLKRRLRWITLNGWLLPAKRRMVTVEKFRPPMQYFFRAGRVLKYDLHTNQALIARRSYREALGVLRHLRRTLRAIDENFDRVAAEFRARHGELVSETSWRKNMHF